MSILPISYEFASSLVFSHSILSLNAFVSPALPPEIPLTKCSLEALPHQLCREHTGVLWGLGSYRLHFLLSFSNDLPMLPCYQLIIKLSDISFAIFLFSVIVELFLFSWTESWETESSLI